MAKRSQTGNSHESVGAKLRSEALQKELAAANVRLQRTMQTLVTNCWIAEDATHSGALLPYAKAAEEVIARCGESKEWLCLRAEISALHGKLLCDIGNYEGGFEKLKSARELAERGELPRMQAIAQILQASSFLDRSPSPDHAKVLIPIALAKLDDAVKIAQKSNGAGREGPSSMVNDADITAWAYALRAEAVGTARLLGVDMGDESFALASLSEALFTIDEAHRRSRRNHPNTPAGFDHITSRACGLLHSVHGAATLAHETNQNVRPDLVSRYGAAASPGGKVDAHRLIRDIGEAVRAAVSAAKLQGASNIEVTDRNPSLDAGSEIENRWAMALPLVEELWDRFGRLGARSIPHRLRYTLGGVLGLEPTRAGIAASRGPSGRQEMRRLTKPEDAGDVLRIVDAMATAAPRARRYR